MSRVLWRPGPLARILVGIGVWLALMVSAEATAAAVAAESGAQPPGDQGKASPPPAEAAPSADAAPVADDDEDETSKPDLDQSVVQSVILSHMSAIRHCYNKELRKDPELAGAVTIRFTVGVRGSVVDAVVKQSTLMNKDVEGCMVEEVKKWLFPEPRHGRPVDISYPFKFKPGS